MKKQSISSVINKTMGSGISELNTFQKAENAKAGRKKMPPSEKKTKFVHFWLSESEYKELQSYANAEYMTIHAFVKRKIMKFLDTKKQSSES